MRRFSQRSHLVTLNEINITPLLDLAFVLLIIFVITTPLLDKGITMNLPTANSATSNAVRKEDVRIVEIDPSGKYYFNKRYQPVEQIVSLIASEFKSNPNLVVYIRADENSRVKDFVRLTDLCTQSGISRYSIRTQPPSNR